MTRTRIAVAGKAGSGKDHVLARLAEYEARRGESIRIMGFGDLVRSYWSDLRPDVEPTRTDLQELGAQAREADSNFWVEKMVSWVNAQPEGVVLGVSGVRFLNEVIGLQRVNFRVGLVMTNSEVRRHRLFHRDGYWYPDEELNHPTETALDRIPDGFWDFTIHND